MNFNPLQGFHPTKCPTRLKRQPEIRFEVNRASMKLMILVPMSSPFISVLTARRPIFSAGYEERRLALGILRER